MSDYVINLDGTESVGPEGVYLVWGDDWTGREVRVEATLDEALRAHWAWSFSDYGTPDYIEGPAGVVPEDEVYAWARATDARSDERSRARREALIGAERFSVQLREADSNKAVEYCDFDDLADAIDCMQQLSKPGRCRVIHTVFTDQHRWSPTDVVMDWDGSTVGEQAA